MINLQTRTILYEGKNSLIYHKQESEWGTPVVVKVLKNKFPTSRQIARFNNEFELTRHLDIPGVRKAYKTEKFQDKYCLVLEYIGGVILRDFWQTQAPGLEVFLKVAIQIAQTLGRIHQHHIIHKDINPNNLLIDPETCQTVIIDFGVSSKIHLKTTHLGNPEHLEGTLAYISPEQTGRMNRVVDSRSDLYSLGVTFYELLNGKLPFEKTDALELVHAHIAQKPSHIKHIPEVLNGIVQKLLAKDAEDRYQSAFGLAQDLKQCMLNLNDTGNIAGFEIGQKDFSGKFKIPERLYGREQELARLHDVFEQTCQGCRTYLMISGYSGVGKSVLVNEIHKPVTEKRGYFIRGKYDQLQRDTPYYAITQAFNQFCEYLLAEDKTVLDEWQKLITEAVGDNGQVLIEVIPRLELVIGVQPAITLLDAQKAQNRFDFVFQNFIRAISRKEHPLVLFIDDLQWADLASLNLLKVLMTDEGNACFLTIGTYRSNEVNASHALMLSLEEIKKEKGQVENIELGSLRMEGLQKLIADSLSASVDEVRELADLIYAKTDGNAFFTVEFFKSLHEQSLLTFDQLQTRWVWSVKKIRARELTNNVIHLMTHKISRLSDVTQQALKLASGIGNQFDLQTLSVLHGQTQAQALTHLWEAVEEGLLTPLDEHHKLLKNTGIGTFESLTAKFKFVHDKIQQATYLLIPESDKKITHLKIGRLLLKKLEENDLASEHLFDAATHLNKALTEISTLKERLQLSRLNLQAGKKAKLSGAYQPAFHYLTVAIQLLPSGSWTSEYALTLDIYNQTVEAAYLNGDHEQMLTLASVIFDNATDLMDKIPAYETKIVAFTVQTKFDSAIKTSLQLLKMLGVKLPQKPGKLQVINSLLKTKTLLKGKTTNDILNLPQMTDKRKLAAIRILNIVLSACYFTNSNLLALVIFKMVRLSVRYGNTQSSTVGYATYGFILCNSLGSVDKGSKFGNLAIDLLKSLNAKVFEAKVAFTVWFFVKYWTVPLQEMKTALLNAYQVGLENGDTEYASYCLSNYSVFPYYYGDNLDQVLIESLECKRLLKKLKQEVSVDRLEIFIQTFLCLVGKTNSPYTLSGNDWNEDTKVKSYLDGKPNNILWNYYFNKQVLYYLFEDYPEAYRVSKLSRKYLSTAAGSFTTCLFYFFDSLIRLSLFQEIKAEEQSSTLKRVKNNQKKLKKWAKDCPQNFLHKFYLVEAEKHRVLGHTDQSIDCYDKAIRLAQQHKFLQDEALSNELAAKFWLKKTKESFAEPYMQRAHHLYGLWGAKAKTRHLEEKYPQLLNNTIASSSLATSSLRETLGDTSGGVLDLASILKASQTLSQEVRLESLIGKMLHVVLENSGAQQGLLISCAQNELIIRAKGNIKMGASMLTGISIENSNLLPKTVVNYVARTKEVVLIDDVAKDKRYASDVYIQKKKPRSMLCFPVLRQGGLSVIFYLENRLVANAFTPSRLETLKMLSSQMAISIENSLLYENLEEKVKERTQELSDKNAEMAATGEILRDLNEQLQVRNKHVAASINYAKRIQRALLPFEEQMLGSLPEHFVFFRPRDVVSGDFYWFEAIEDKIFIVAGDCTGHGVPGAFMTMLGSQALTNIIVQKKVHSPEQVLQLLDETLRVLLRSKQSAVSDGMDVVITVIDKQKQELHYAGAKNPLALIKNGEIEMIKGDIYSINGYRKKGVTGKFTLHTFDLSVSFCFYMYSDGVQDQFGGENGKKFSRKKLRQLLLDVHQRPMTEQGEILAKAVDEWQGYHEQVDDMLLIGVRCVPGMF